MKQAIWRTVWRPGGTVLHVSRDFIRTACGWRMPRGAYRSDPAPVDALGAGRRRLCRLCLAAMVLEDSRAASPR